MFRVSVADNREQEKKQRRIASSLTGSLLVHILFFLLLLYWQFSREALDAPLGKKDPVFFMVSDSGYESRGQEGSHETSVSCEQQNDENSVTADAVLTNQGVVASAADLEQQQDSLCFVSDEGIIGHEHEFFSELDEKPVLDLALDTHSSFTIDKAREEQKKAQSEEIITSSPDGKERQTQITVAQQHRTEPVFLIKKKNKEQLKKKKKTVFAVTRAVLNNDAQEKGRRLLAKNKERVMERIASSVPGYRAPQEKTAENNNEHERNKRAKSYFLLKKYEYDRAVRQKASRAWSAYGAKQHLILDDKEYGVTVDLSVDRFGNLKKCCISKSSGNPWLDALIKKTLRAAEPFSPPSQDLLDQGIYCVEHTFLILPRAQ